MGDEKAGVPSKGVMGALSIGIGGIVGGGFFATFGLTIEGAKGGTPLAFLIGGLVALLTAYSYIPLTLRYPGPGGTAAFIRIAFGRGLLAASINVLLILSYVAIMSVYAVALASYSLPYLPPGSRAVAGHVIASLAVIVLGLVNFAGAALIERLGLVFNVGKLAVLGLFIVGGFVVGQLDWGRLEPAAWSPASSIVASGMLGFLAYEGFELIANASNDIIDPKRTLPIAFLGSVIAAIIIYMLAFIVAIGHMSFDAIIAARDFGVSAAASSFLGPTGFTIMAAGAILASASAINADYFGAAKLPVMLSLARGTAIGLSSQHSRQVGRQSSYGWSPRPHRRQRAWSSCHLGCDERWISCRIRGGQYGRDQACPRNRRRTYRPWSGSGPVRNSPCSDDHRIPIGSGNGRFRNCGWRDSADCRSHRGGLQSCRRSGIVMTLAAGSRLTSIDRSRALC